MFDELGDVVFVFDDEDFYGVVDGVCRDFM